MTLVDTSSWIEYLRQSESAPSTRVEGLVLDGEAAWCDMTLVELWNGVRGAREKRELAEMEKEIIPLPINTEVWRVACRLALRCREAGLTVPANDIVVAACATEYQVELEHCDSHFDKILPVAAKL
ncbi:MAG: PIN domain-containing protein [Limisphaerales bacterium]